MKKYTITRDEKDYFKFNEIDLKDKRMTLYLSPNGTGKTRISKKIFEKAFSLSNENNILPVRYCKDSLEISSGKIQINSYFTFTKWGNVIEKLKREIDHVAFNEHLNLTTFKNGVDSNGLEYLTNFLRKWNNSWTYYRISQINEIQNKIFSNEALWKSAITHIKTGMGQNNKFVDQPFFIPKEELFSSKELMFNYFTYATDDLEKTLEADFEIPTQEWEEYISSDLFQYIENFIEKANNSNYFYSALIGLKKFLLLKFLLREGFNSKIIDMANEFLYFTSNDLTSFLNERVKRFKENLTELDIDIKKYIFNFTYDNVWKTNNLEVRNKSNKIITKSFFEKLSRGEKGRFNFSLCLFLINTVNQTVNGKKTFLILDDPVDSYDSYHKTIMGEMLLNLKQSNVKVLMFTHDVELTSQIKNSEKYFFERNQENPIILDNYDLRVRGIIEGLIKNYRNTGEEHYILSLLFLSRRLNEKRPSTNSSIQGIEQIFYDSTIEFPIIKSIVSIIYNKDLTVNIKKLKNKFCEYISIKIEKVIIIKRLISENITNQKIKNYKEKNRIFINLISHNEDDSLNYFIMVKTKTLDRKIKEIRKIIKTDY